MTPNNVTELVALRSQRHENRDSRRRALEAAGVRVRIIPKLKPPAKAASTSATAPAKTAPKPATADVWSGDPAKLFAARDKAMAAGRKP